MLQDEFDIAKCCKEMAVKLLMNSGEIYFKHIPSKLGMYNYTKSLEDVCMHAGYVEFVKIVWLAIGYVARMLSSYTIFFAYHIAIVFGTYSYINYVICLADSM